jgi:hypothetical protein
MRRSQLRMLAAGASALLVVGCGIIELGTEGPEGLDDPAEPIGDTEPVHPADDDVDNAEGTD